VNKTAIALAYIALAVIGFIGAVVILIFKPESFGVLVGFVVTLLAVVVTGTTTIYSLGKQNQTLAQIQTQTNGNTTKLLEHNAELLAEIARLRDAPAATVSTKRKPASTPV
jgi:predicted PurR-regulated permease PerM